MGIFLCGCGTLENTAFGNFWIAGMEGEVPKCSECETGKWHGKFPKRTLVETGYVELESGYYGPADGSWGKPKKPKG